MNIGVVIVISGICTVIMIAGGLYLYHAKREPPALFQEIPWDPKETLLWSYPGVMQLLQKQKIWGRGAKTEEKVAVLQKIYTDWNREQLWWLWCCRVCSRIYLGIMTLALLTLVAILADPVRPFLYQSSYLLREEPGGDNRDVALEVRAMGEKKKVTVTVPARVYNREEINARMAEAKRYIQKNYLGNNTSSEHVLENLDLMRRIPDSLVSVKWKLDQESIVSQDGSLQNEELDQERQICITAVLSYQETKERLPLELIVYPAKRTKRQLFWKQWNEAITQLNQESSAQKVQTLPKNIDGTEVVYRESFRKTWPRILVLGFLLICCIPVWMEYQNSQSIRQREKQLRKDYPEVLERLILLIGAGMTVKGAWIRIIKDYQTRREQEGLDKRYVYEEMLISWKEMDNGSSESRVYEEFGRRISILSYIKLGSLLSQNLRKGTDDLLMSMEREAEDALRERRDSVRVMGEEAGTRLLFPMMIMLSMVFGLILVAAFQSI